jgi:hypothetical protein
MAKKKTKKKTPSYLDTSKAKSRRAKLVKYAKENPLEAASIAAMGIPVAGWAASGVLRTAAGAAKLYKKRKTITKAAKKVYEKVKTKAGPTVKKTGEKLRKAFGPKHKKAGKVYSTQRGAEMGRAGSTKHKVVRKKDKVTTFRGKKTTKKQYGIEPTARSAITSKKALFTAGAATYVGSQLMSKKTSKPKKKTNGGGAKPPKGYNPGSVPSQQGKGTGRYKDRDSAGPNAIAQPRKKGPVKRKPQGERKYKPGTSGGDRPATKMHGSEIFRKRLGGQRKPGSRGGY